MLLLPASHLSKTTWQMSLLWTCLLGPGSEWVGEVGGGHNITQGVSDTIATFLLPETAGRIIVWLLVDPQPPTREECSAYRCRGEWCQCVQLKQIKIVRFHL